ncbi:transcription antitermination factor NusB [Kribbella catacumbae]|uniref:transcription antitermination factor NusB n=1 Tax=Kribbella catacumbae TaxID=460086 RepID=UPI0003678AA5|nr:transcription antitermination factor NusB [Kribbella catacumbae]
MSARSKARKRALDVLYESEVRGLSVGGTLADRVADNDPPVNEFTVALVEGVSEHIESIDDLLSTHSVGWSLDRMPAVDRNILRIGVYELLFDEQVPDVVAVSEAVSMARDLSTDESPAFVNGLLARLLQLKPTLGV